MNQKKLHKLVETIASRRFRSEEKLLKNVLSQIIENEDARKPVSDQKIVELLRRQNIEIARRTVAKYREMLGILSSSKRRKIF